MIQFYGIFSTKISPCEFVQCVKNVIEKIGKRTNYQHQNINIFPCQYAHYMMSQRTYYLSALLFASFFVV